MILLRKTLLWSLPIWCLLVWVVYPLVESNDIIHQIKSMLVVLIAPGLALVLLWTRNIHNTDIDLVVIVNCLVYSGLLYLFFLLKERFNVYKSKKDTLK